jgi:hypothetical protein
MRSSATTTASQSSYSSPPTTSSNQDKYDRFEQWLRDNGAQFDLLELCEYESVDDDAAVNLQQPSMRQETSSPFYEEKKEATNTRCNMTRRMMDHPDRNADNSNTTANSELRGVYAKTYLPPHTVCMSIPRRCLITVEMGQATPIGQLILQSDLDLDAPKHIFLMVYLLWDRKVNGPRR